MPALERFTVLPRLMLRCSFDVPQKVQPTWGSKAWRSPRQDRRPPQHPLPFRLRGPKQAVRTYQYHNSKGPEFGPMQYDHEIGVAGGQDRNGIEPWEYPTL